MPCDSSLFMKEYWKDGKLLSRESYYPQHFSESFQYFGDQLTFSTLKNEPVGKALKYTYIFENDEPILKFTTETGVDSILPVRFEYKLDENGLCKEEKIHYRGDVETFEIVRYQYYADTLIMKTFLTQEGNPYRVEMHEFKDGSLVEISLRKVSETRPFAWVRRLEE